ncbi:MAG: PA4780 family RIO1-like protein kinase [Pseudomonadota bacterium]
MRVPESLVPLVEQGVIEEVLRPLMSGKEAQVYLVMAHGQQCVAKVYKQANDRTFKHRSEYIEGRQVRNTRDQRAMTKGSTYGRAKQEAGWSDVEADVIFRLRDAGVRVPEPMAYVDNVLVMELVIDRKGDPALRLADLTLQQKQAEEVFDGLIQEVRRMLCAGLVHGDLSEFNILAGRKGAVIIDFPQAVEASTNRNARKLLIRDTGNLTRFFGRFSGRLRSLRYGEEMWDLYERGELTPDTLLTGRYKSTKGKVEVSSMLAEIQEAERENRDRRVALGLPPARPARQPHRPPENRPAVAAKPELRTERKPDRARHRPSSNPRAKPKPEQRADAQRMAAPAPPAKPQRRRWRRRKTPGGGAPGV